MKKVEITIKNKGHLATVLENKNGDTFTIKSEEFDDFLIGCKVITGNTKDNWSKKDMINFGKYIYDNWIEGQTIDKVFLEWSIKHYR